MELPKQSKPVIRNVNMESIKTGVGSSAWCCKGYCERYKKNMSPEIYSNCLANCDISC